MKIINKNKMKFTLFIFGILLFLNYVCALGFNVPDPVVISPGETKDIQIMLKAGSPDIPQGSNGIDLIFELTKDEGIVNLLDQKNVYFVSPPDTEGVVNLRVSIPKSVPIGTKYNIQFNVRNKDSIKSSGDGTVGYVFSVNGGFNVDVVEKPVEVQVEQPVTPSTEKGNNLIWTVILVIVLAVIVVAYFLYGKKPGKKK